MRHTAGRFAKRAYAVDGAPEHEDRNDEVASSEHSSDGEEPETPQAHAVADDDTSQCSEPDSDQDDASSEDSAVADAFMAGSKAGWKAKGRTADRRAQRGFRKHPKPCPLYPSDAADALTPCDSGWSSSLSIKKHNTTPHTNTPTTTSQ